MASILSAAVADMLAVFHWTKGWFLKSAEESKLPENREFWYMSVTKLAQPDDFVVVEFSHNDGGAHKVEWQWPFQLPWHGRCNVHEQNWDSGQGLRCIYVRSHAYFCAIESACDYIQPNAE
jgi:hypothetical protein